MLKKKETAITGYKGFDKNMQCRGFQFEVGKTYKHDGPAKCCESGFHFCENPLDVFSYYSPGESTFAAVIGSGETATHDEDSKVACTNIKIKAAISLHDFIKASVDFLLSKNKPAEQHSDGNSSASSATGYSSASSATGNSSASSATGYRSASSATGNRSASSATGYSSASSATGNRSASSATGNSSASSATGNRSASSATGDSSASVCTGLESKAMAGKYGCIALAWWNAKKERSEMRCAETGNGKDGKLKPDAWYTLDKNGNFIEA